MWVSTVEARIVVVVVKLGQLANESSVFNLLFVFFTDTSCIFTWRMDHANELLAKGFASTQEVVSLAWLLVFNKFPYSFVLFVVTIECETRLPPF